MSNSTTNADTNLRIGVSYDFRNPPDSGVSDRTLYAEILEQVKWLDQIGADLVWFTEHHFVEDGYLPSWVPVAGAMASVTHHTFSFLQKAHLRRIAIAVTPVYLAP